MKKCIYVIATLILATSLVACNNESTKNDTEQVASQVIEQDIPKEENIVEVKKYLENNYSKVNIDGSTSMIPLHQSLNNLFSDNQEEVVHRKTVEAFEKLISGENDILLGVDYSDELLEKAKNSGVKLVKKEITREAFVFLINKNNPIKSLTIDKIKDIYSGKITNWVEVGGDDALIKTYQRNIDSGSQIRMTKFMGNTKLMEKDVEYVSSMGHVIEKVGDYNVGKYSIAYNMYTFTEKQYANDEVILLNINGIEPNDESIFDETYPINIYNYLYYDEHNALAKEYSEKMYIYLMSEEGQRLINNSGYVNINKKFEINKNIDKPYENDFETELDFYNEEKGEFYDVVFDDKGKGELLVFKNFNDYILRNTKYKNNVEANNFLTTIFNADIEKTANTIWLNETEGIITLNPSFESSLDFVDFFNFKYGNIYYSYFNYLIDEDKYVLSSLDKDTFDLFLSDDSLNGLEEYTNNYLPDSKIVITKEEFKNLYLRTNIDDKTQNRLELNFFQPFK